LSGGQYTTLDNPNAQVDEGTFITGINNRGQMTGYYFDDNFINHGFLLSDGQFTNLDPPNAAFGSIPNGINDSGEIVGVYGDANDVTHAFLATPAPGQSGLIAMNSVAGLVAAGSQSDGTSPGTLMVSIAIPFVPNSAGSLGSTSTEQTTAIATS